MRPIAFALLPLLAGCTATVSVPEAGAPAACDPARVESFVGKAASAVSADARAAAGATSVRVIGPGDAVTMDYRGDRLNLETDADGIVLRVRCG